MHIVYSTNNFNFKLRTLALQIILFVLLGVTAQLKEDLKCVMVVSGILSVGSILVKVLQVQSVISLDLLQTIVKVIELSYPSIIILQMQLKFLMVVMAVGQQIHFSHMEAVAGGTTMSDAAVSVNIVMIGVMVNVFQNALE